MSRYVVLPVYRKGILHEQYAVFSITGDGELWLMRGGFSSSVKAHSWAQENLP